MYKGSSSNALLFNFICFYLILTQGSLNLSALRTTLKEINLKISTYYDDNQYTNTNAKISLTREEIKPKN